MNNRTTSQPNIESMNMTIRQLQIQIRQQEIRLDIVQNDQQIRFFLEEDEIKLVSDSIMNKIAHLRNCCTELIGDTESFEVLNHNSTSIC